jgi:uncharacterized alpha-E superfamily protein
MLSRTAENLYWLGRYSERAGNVARGLSATLRMASLAAPLGTAGEEWQALLIATGSDPGFRAKHAEATQEAALHFLTLEPDNPSSIVACIEAARRNGRAVRTALTVDMWEAINDTWRALRGPEGAAVQGDRLPAFLDWVKERTLLFNGAAADTMLRGEAWHFIDLGTMLERADNTARLLDVRYHALSRADAGGPADYAQAEAVLRAVSALRSYQHVYRARLQPRLVAELLILRPELPRSILACLARVASALERIAASSGRRGMPHPLADGLVRRLKDTSTDAIFRQGLHAFLTELIDANIGLGGAIDALYLRG